MPTYHSASGSAAEDLFIELFSETFGAEKAGYLYSQYQLRSTPSNMAGRLLTTPIARICSWT